MEVFFPLNTPILFISQSKHFDSEFLGLVDEGMCAGEVSIQSNVLSGYISCA